MAIRRLSAAKRGPQNKGIIEADSFTKTYVVGDTLTATADTVVDGMAVKRGDIISYMGGPVASSASWVLHSTTADDDAAPWVENHAYEPYALFSITTPNTTAEDANGDEIPQNKTVIARYQDTSGPTTSSGSLTNAEMSKMVMVTASLGLRGIPVATEGDLAVIKGKDFELRRVNATGRKYIFSPGVTASGDNLPGIGGAWIYQPPPAVIRQLDALTDLDGGPATEGEVVKVVFSPDGTAADARLYAITTGKSDGAYEFVSDGGGTFYATPVGNTTYVKEVDNAETVINTSLADLGTGDFDLPLGYRFYYVRRKATHTQPVTVQGGPTLTDNEWHFYRRIDDYTVEYMGAPFKEVGTSVLADFTAGAAKYQTAMIHTPETINEVLKNSLKPTILRGTTALDLDNLNLPENMVVVVENTSPTQNRNLTWAGATGKVTVLGQPTILNAGTVYGLSPLRVALVERQGTEWLISVLETSNIVRYDSLADANASNTLHTYNTIVLISGGGIWQRPTTSGTVEEFTDTDPSKWVRVDTAAPRRMPEWSPTESYVTGNQVQYGAALYLALADSTNANPQSDTGATWLQIDGPTVDSYSIAQDQFADRNGGWATFVNEVALNHFWAIKMIDAGTFDFNQDGNPLTVEADDVIVYAYDEWRLLDKAPAVIADKAVNAGTVYDLDTELPTDGTLWLKTTDGSPQDIQLQVTSPAITFRTRDGETQTAHAANTPVTLNGTKWRVRRDGDLITVFELAGGSKGYENLGALNTGTYDFDDAPEQGENYLRDLGGGVNVTGLPAGVTDDASTAWIAEYQSHSDSTEYGVLRLYRIKAGEPLKTYTRARFSDAWQDWTPTAITQSAVYATALNTSPTNVAANTNLFFNFAPYESSGITYAGNIYYPDEANGQNTYHISAHAGLWNTSGNEAWSYLIIDVYDNAGNKIREVANTRSRTLEVDGTGNKSGNGLSVSATVKLDANQGFAIRLQHSQTMQVMTRNVSIHKVFGDSQYVDKGDVVEVEDVDTTLIDVDAVNGTTYDFSTGETWAQIKANYERLIITGNASRAGSNQIRPWSFVLDLGSQLTAVSQSGYRMDFTNDYSVTIWADVPGDTATGLTYRQSGGDAPTSGRMQFKVVGVKARKTVNTLQGYTVDDTGAVDGDTAAFADDGAGGLKIVKADSVHNVEQGTWGQGIWEKRGTILEVSGRSAVTTGGTITFPQAFSGTPVITCTPMRSGDNLAVTIQSVTTTDFTYWVVRNEDDLGTAAEVHFTAKGIAADPA